MTAVRRILARINELPAPETPAAWYLDIDGVLSLISPTRPIDWPTYEYSALASDFGYLSTFTWAPGLMAAINALHNRGHVSVRWLSSWGYQGPQDVAPMLGLSVGARVAGESGGDKTMTWKISAFAEEDTSIGLRIWTDDHLPDDATMRRLAAGLPTTRIVAIRPDPARGLTPHDINTVIDALAENQ